MTDLSIPKVHKKNASGAQVWQPLWWRQSEQGNWRVPGLPIWIPLRPLIHRLHKVTPATELTGKAGHPTSSVTDLAESTYRKMWASEEQGFVSPWGANVRIREQSFSQGGKRRNQKMYPERPLSVLLIEDCFQSECIKENYLEWVPLPIFFHIKNNF